MADIHFGSTRFMVLTMKGWLELFWLWCMPTLCLSTCLPNVTAPSFIQIYEGGAGLNSRRSVFSHLGSLAGYLSAQLIPRPPVEMLTPMHNHGKRVDAHLDWSHYLNFTFGDGTLVFNTTSAAATVKGIQTVSSFKEP